MKNLLIELIALTPCFLLGWSYSAQWGGQTHSVPEWFKITRFRFLTPLCVLLAWAVIARHWFYGVSPELRAVIGLLSMEFALVSVIAGVVANRLYRWLRKKVEDSREPYGNDPTGY